MAHKIQQSSLLLNFEQKFQDFLFVHELIEILSYTKIFKHFLSYGLAFVAGQQFLELKGVALDGDFIQQFLYLLETAEIYAIVEILLLVLALCRAWRSIGQRSQQAIRHSLRAHMMQVIIKS